MEQCLATTFHEIVQYLAVMQRLFLLETLFASPKTMIKHFNYLYSKNGHELFETCVANLYAQCKILKKSSKTVEYQKRNHV